MRVADGGRLAVQTVNSAGKVGSFVPGTGRHWQSRISTAINELRPDAWRDGTVGETKRWTAGDVGGLCL